MIEKIQKDEKSVLCYGFLLVDRFELVAVLPRIVLLKPQVVFTVFSAAGDLLFTLIGVPLPTTPVFTLPFDLLLRSAAEDRLVLLAPPMGVRTFDPETGVRLDRILPLDLLILDIFTTVLAAGALILLLSSTAGDNGFVCALRSALSTATTPFTSVFWSCSCRFSIVPIVVEGLVEPTVCSLLPASHWFMVQRYSCLTFS